MLSKSLVVRVIGVSLLCGVACNADSKKDVAEPCDRACLIDYVDQYLAALVAHEPERLPLAESVRYTENGQTMSLGDGMWGPASGIGDYKLYFADPTAGQVGYFGVVEENDHPQIVAIRLKVESRLITEIETIVARSIPDAWVNPAGLIAHPVFSELLAPSERRSREELIAITDSYFEGLEQATADLTPFDSDCTRIENGHGTANNPEGASPIHMMTCGEQFATGFSTFITEIRERRFPVVDEERGLVYAIIFFDHAGTVKTVAMAGGMTMTVPPPYDTPYTFIIGELFKIVDGKILRIEAVLWPVPYRMPSGWGGRQ